MATFELQTRPARTRLVPIRALETYRKHGRCSWPHPARVRGLDLICHPGQLDATWSAHPLALSIEFLLSTLQITQALSDFGLSQIQQTSPFGDVLPAIRQCLNLEIDQSSNAAPHRNAGHLAVSTPHIPQRRRDRNLDLLPPLSTIHRSKKAPIRVSQLPTSYTHRDSPSFLDHTQFHPPRMRYTSVPMSQEADLCGIGLQCGDLVRGPRYNIERMFGNVELLRNIRWPFRSNRGQDW